MLQDRPTSRPVGLSDDLFAVIWDSAWHACIRAFLVLLFGGIAISIVGGIFEDMIPSRPPLFTGPSAKHHTSAGTPANGTPQLESEPSAQQPGNADTPGDDLPKHDSPARPYFPQFHHIDWTPLTKDHFVIVAAIFFSVSMWNRLRYGPPDESCGPSRRQRIINNLSENWFGMVVGNAFGAMISAMVLVWVQNFSWAQMLWQWVFQDLLSTFQPVAEAILGRGRLGSFEQWWNWYGDNQFRFTFWFFYVAAICDDLGLPNFKTLGRWLGRRWRKRRQATAPSIQVSGKVNNVCKNETANSKK